MKRTLAFILIFLILNTASATKVSAEVPQSVTDLIKADYMKNADFSILVKEAGSEKIVADYNANDNMIPASVLKIAATATALEILGEDYRFTTLLQHDGEIKDGILNGNIYIKGSGDPTLGSGYFETGTDFINDWINAIQSYGIKKITGSVISDESVLDNEGISPKWLAEDLGNAYSAGSYGINVFDNSYSLSIKTGNAGTRPVIQAVTPGIAYDFNNNLTASSGLSSAFIFGVPFSNERYLLGYLPANSSCVLEGDISDPPLYLAVFLTDKLIDAGITVDGKPSSGRLHALSGKALSQERHNIAETYSPALGEIISVTNIQSHNLFADALLKAISSEYQKNGETMSSFEKGVSVLKDFWDKNQIDSSAIDIYDGSGLSAVNRVTASFICEILEYMAVKSSNSKAFTQSLPAAGVDGTVRNFLSNTPLQGKAMIKSGSMDRVRAYAGYVNINEKVYIVCILANNYNCSGYEMTRSIEKVLLNIFSY